MQAPDNAGAIARVFYALVPPPPLRSALGELAGDAARRAHGRPVPADNIHLTLAFVGDIAVARIPALIAIGASLRARRMFLELDRQGSFRRAGVAWIAPSAPPEALTHLAAAIGRALDADGISQEARAFHPHLTLARRCRGPYAPLPAGPFPWLVDHVVLMQSELRIEAARYRLLSTWALAA
jgi:2'-5' RNA ligase